MANTILHKSTRFQTSQESALSGSTLVDADVSSKKYVDDQINFAVVASAAGLLSNRELYNG
jgi:hypothetical protein